MIFTVTAFIFSALAPLRYLRGHTLFDYKLWYETGQHVLAGDAIYFFYSWLMLRFAVITQRVLLEKGSA